VIEQIAAGGEKQKVVISSIFKELKRIINLYKPSPYHPKDIIFSIECWFQEPLPPQMIGSWIKDVIPKQPLYRKEPNHIRGEIHPTFTKWIGHHFFPKAYLCFFKNARIVNENGAIISHDDKVFSDFTYQLCKQIKDHDVFKSYIKKPDIRKECFATITASESVGYFHWMFECFPRIKLLEEVIDEIDYLIVSDNVKSFQLEMLNHLGFSEDKLFKIKDGDHLECENIFVPSLPIRDALMSKWVCDFLRETFVPENIDDPYRLIYISRKDALYRKVTNENEVESYLREKGFEILQMSKLSFLEQVKKCAEAKVIIAPHGAGLSNTVFCKNAKILEFFSPSYVNECFWKLSNHVGNEYYYQLGTDTPGNSPPSFKNYKISIKELEDNLRKMAEEIHSDNNI
jgi:hypothetical protein